MSQRRPGPGTHRQETDWWNSVQVKYFLFLSGLQVRVLFSKGPFISIFASDPHIIIKAINQNLNSVLRDSNINGHDYMRNIVHLPVFLNSRGLSSARKVCPTAPANGDTGNAEGNHGDT